MLNKKNKGMGVCLIVFLLSTMILSGCGSKSAEVDIKDEEKVSEVKDVTDEMPEIMNVSDFDKFIASYVSVDDFSEPEYSDNGKTVSYNSNEINKIDIDDILIDEIYTSIPCTLQEFIDSGWKIETMPSSKVKPGERLPIEVINDNGTKLIIKVYNESDNSKSSMECKVTYVSVHVLEIGSSKIERADGSPSSYKVGAVTNTSDLKEIIETFGQPYRIVYNTAPYTEKLVVEYVTSNDYILSFNLTTDGKRIGHWAYSASDN